MRLRPLHAGMGAPAEPLRATARHVVLLGAPAGRRAVQRQRAPAVQAPPPPPPPPPPPSPPQAPRAPLFMRYHNAASSLGESSLGYSLVGIPGGAAHIPFKPSVEDLAVGPIPEELRCPICLDVFQSPVVCVPCGHEFCGPCLQRSRQQSRAGAGAAATCPSCRSDLAGCCPPALSLRNLVSALRVRCDNGVSFNVAAGKYEATEAEGACQEELRLEQRRGHLKACPSVLVRCEFAAHGCPEVLPCGRTAEHRRTCGFRPALCTCLGLPCSRPQAADYEPVCPAKVVACPLGCGASFPRAQLERHLSSQCRPAMEEEDEAAASGLKRKADEEEEGSRSPPKRVRGAVKEVEVSDPVYITREQMKLCHKRGGDYRVYMGPFPSRQAAQEEVDAIVERSNKFGLEHGDLPAAGTVVWFLKQMPEVEAEDPPIAWDTLTRAEGWKLWETYTGGIRTDQAEVLVRRYGLPLEACLPLSRKAACALLHEMETRPSLKVSELTFEKAVSYEANNGAAAAAQR